MPAWAVGQSDLGAAFKFEWDVDAGVCHICMLIILVKRELTNIEYYKQI